MSTFNLAVMALCLPATAALDIPSADPYVLATCIAPSTPVGAHAPTSSWVKNLNGTFDLVNEPASKHSIDVYEWVTVVIYENGAARLVRQWRHAFTLHPGQTSTRKLSGDIKFVVRGLNHIAASDHPWGLSACWGTRLGEPAQAWLRMVKR
jgi:hypothetical protein